MQFKLRVTGPTGFIRNPVFEIDRSATFQIPIEIQAGQTLLVEKEAIARIYDAKGSQMKAFPLTAKLPRVLTGMNRVQFDCEFLGDTPPKVSVQFKTRGQVTPIHR